MTITKNSDSTITMSMVRGDYEKVIINIVDEAIIFDSGDRIDLQVRTSTSADDFLVSASHVFSASSMEDSIELEIQSADTEWIEPGTYVYDIQIVTDGKARTIVPTSPFIILPDVTRGLASVDGEATNIGARTFTSMTEEDLDVILNSFTARVRRIHLQPLAGEDIEIEEVSHPAYT